MSGFLDLSENAAVTTALLMDPLAWRIRAVDSITVDTASSVLRRRSLQVAPLRSVIADAAGISAQLQEGAECEALLVLPVAPAPRGPLLNFDLEGAAGAPAYLLPRTTIASLEADFLTVVAETEGMAVATEARVFLEAVLGFSEGPWDEARAIYSGGQADILRDYLADGTGLEKSHYLIQRWVRTSYEVQDLLTPWVESSKGVSAVEQPALVIPGLVAQGLVSSVDQVEYAFLAYEALLWAAVNQVAAELDPGDFLNSLIDYGRNYEVMAVTKGAPG